jgi:hypothetical protein
MELHKITKATLGKHEQSTGAHLSTFYDTRKDKSILYGGAYPITEVEERRAKTYTPNWPSCSFHLLQM